MVRTIGATDLRYRQSRKDKGKKRKRYAGKPVKKKRKKGGRFVPYVSKRGRDAPIKLWFWQELMMSKDGYRRWSRDTRKYARKIVYKPTLRIDVDPYQISNKALIEKLCLDNLWTGTWLIMGFSKGRNKYGVKPVKLCKVRITEHSEGMKAKMISNFRLFRYWYWSES